MANIEEIERQLRESKAREADLADKLANAQKLVVNNLPNALPPGALDNTKSIRSVKKILEDYCKLTNENDKIENQRLLDYEKQTRQVWPKFSTGNLDDLPRPFISLAHYFRKTAGIFAQRLIDVAGLSNDVDDVIKKCKSFVVLNQELSAAPVDLPQSLDRFIRASAAYAHPLSQVNNAAKPVFEHLEAQILQKRKDLKGQTAFTADEKELLADAKDEFLKGYAMALMGPIANDFRRTLGDAANYYGMKIVDFIDASEAYTIKVNDSDFAARVVRHGLVARIDTKPGDNLRRYYISTTEDKHVTKFAKFEEREAANSAKKNNNSNNNNIKHNKSNGSFSKNASSSPNDRDREKDQERDRNYVETKRDDRREERRDDRNSNSHGQGQKRPREKQDCPHCSKKQVTHTPDECTFHPNATKAAENQRKWDEIRSKKENKSEKK